MNEFNERIATYSILSSNHSRKKQNTDERYKIRYKLKPRNSSIRSFPLRTSAFANNESNVCLIIRFSIRRAAVTSLFAARLYFRVLWPSNALTLI